MAARWRALRSSTATFALDPRFADEDEWRSVARAGLVPARGRHALAEAPRDAPRAPADARADGEAVVELATSGTLLHVGRDGKILLVDRGPPGGLRLVDGRGAPVGAFRPPPSLRLAD